ncbi:MAG: hypothetical protein J1F03_10480 [Oscillospiraceae bacterium]|nr:hypothetical protein [Oscillospiraceae bacterium]
MIRFFIKNEHGSTKFDMPTEELFDHLGCIGILEDIPLRSSEKIQLEYYPTEASDKIAEIICDRLSPEDKISEVNALCERLENAWKISFADLKTALDTLDIHGAKQICEVVDNLEFQARQSMNMQL